MNNRLSTDGFQEANRKTVCSKLCYHKKNFYLREEFIYDNFNLSNSAKKMDQFVEAKKCYYLYQSVIATCFSVMQHYIAAVFSISYIMQNIYLRVFFKSYK